MVASYGIYSASATGGNGFARDFLAGLAALYAEPRNWPNSVYCQDHADVDIVYSTVGKQNHLANASTILGCLAAVLVVPIYIFYWYGPKIRARSPFAQKVEATRLRERELLPIVEA
jgi:hypothetical protein